MKFFCRVGILHCIACILISYHLNIIWNIYVIYHCKYYMHQMTIRNVHFCINFLTGEEVIFRSHEYSTSLCLADVFIIVQWNQVTFIILNKHFKRRCRTMMWSVVVHDHMNSFHEYLHLLSTYALILKIQLYSYC